MREVTYRTFPDGTFVLEITTTPGPVVHLAVIEPDEAAVPA